jgi:lysophospholipase L1-like esterase
MASGGPTRERHVPGASGQLGGRVTRLAVAALAVLAALDTGPCAAAEPPRTLPAARGDGLLYVALGDSTVAGAGATRPEHDFVSRLLERLRREYGQARARNLGMPSATAGDVAARQLPEAVRLAPQLVTVSVGPNDVLDEVRLEVFERNLAAILERLLQDTRALIVVNLIPDFVLTPKFRSAADGAALAARIRRFNEVLARRVSGHDVVLVDLYLPSQAALPAHPELVSADGYHPSDLGYELWAELMWAAIAPRVPAREGGPAPDPR